MSSLRNKIYICSAVPCNSNKFQACQFSRIERDFTLKYFGKFFPAKNEVVGPLKMTCNAWAVTNRVITVIQKK